MPISNQPQAAVIMGSDSDWPVMKKCVEMLDQFEIGYTVRVSSAHRTPEDTCEFAENALDQGIKVIIAAAGMAAHLAGVLAAHTTLPIIGVPMDAGPLKGIDALLSTVQMPPGVPVATVGIGSAGAKNAGLLAVQILSTGNNELVGKLQDYKKKMAEAVHIKNGQLQQELNNS